MYKFHCMYRLMHEWTGECMYVFSFQAHAQILYALHIGSTGPFRDVSMNYNLILT